MSWRNQVFRRVIRGPEDLHDYQIEAEEWLYHRPFSALYVDVGKGKTIIIETLLDRLFDEGFEGKVLVVAPIRVATRVWMMEHRLWNHVAYLRPRLLRISDDDIRLKISYDKAYKRAREKYVPAMATRIAVRMRTKKKNQLRQDLLVNGVKDGSRIHIIDHGSVDWIVDQCLSRKAWPYKIVIFDEASRLGDHKSQTFLALKKVRNSIDRLHELTATPASQTYMKLFSQIWLLDKGDRFGSFITHFRDRYFDHNHYSREYRLKDGADKEIERKLSDLCFVLKDKRQALIRPRYIQLGNNLMKQYRNFEATAILQGSDPIEATTAANLSSKLLQLASGAVYDESKRYHVFHNEKIEDLNELSEQTLDQPIMVAYWFRSSLDRLRKAFPRAAIMDREGRMEELWNKREFKMMLVHPRSVGHGMNLQFGGHHLVLFDIFWPLELFLQLIGRLDRQGQTETVIVHLLSAVGTMDETVTAKLQYLENAQDAMFQRLRALYRKLHQGR